MIKVLLVHPNRNDATNWYRCLGPFSHLEKFGHIKLTDGSVSNYEFSWPNIMQHDVIYFQRPCGKDHLDIMRMAKALKKTIWCDWDDDYLNIPKTNPRHVMYHQEGRQHLVIDCIQAADIITVSTPAIRETYQQYAENFITVVPNAYDETLFEMPEVLDQQKIVVYRGGDTHGASMEANKEDILKCIHDYPGYTWVFMGTIPLFVSQDLSIPNERLKMYEFHDIMTYFGYLMELRPEIMIMPLEDNHFNRARSNSSWIEATLAGAVMVATMLPEFEKPGIIPAPIGSFRDAFHHAVTCNFQNFHNMSKEWAPSLAKVNRLRVDILNQITPKKIKPVKIEQFESFTDEYFFNFYVKSGWTQETEGHRQANIKAVEWMIEEFKPKRVLELGSGPGLMLERFHQDQIYALGVELNPYFVEYFRQRNPLTKDMVIEVDLTGELRFPEPFDLCISIEVFEHINMPEEKWDILLQNLARNCKWFVFSSTPYSSSIKFDSEWNHVNLRRLEKWIELFTKNGWVFHNNPNRIVQWDMVFKSKIYGGMEKY